MDKNCKLILGRVNAANNPIFNTQKFLNTDASYKFENTDNPAFPTMGIKTALKVGYTSSLHNANNFVYLIPSISFDYSKVWGGQSLTINPGNQKKWSTSHGGGFFSCCQYVRSKCCCI